MGGYVPVGHEGVGREGLSPLGGGTAGDEEVIAQAVGGVAGVVHPGLGRDA